MDPSGSDVVFVPPDYRLNPVLRKACKADIPKFCQTIVNKATDETELEGQVISCLKLKYADQVGHGRPVSPRRLLNVSLPLLVACG